MELWTCIFILSNITSSTHSPSRTNIKPKEKEGEKWKRNKSQKIARAGWAIDRNLLPSSASRP